MKIQAALCFLISYEHLLNHEAFWKKWIRKNKDIIQVFFHCSHPEKARQSSSPWIQKHMIPLEYTVKTDYMHIAHAYFSTMKYVFLHDKRIKWFCFLTESCAPIISPEEFRWLFFQNYDKSFLSWKRAWWNVQYNRRANLHLLSLENHLANTPWFVLSRRDVALCLVYQMKNPAFVKLICAGAVANESVFAIVLNKCGVLNSPLLKNEATTLMDWNRMTSPTSPYVFEEDTEENRTCVVDLLKKNPYAMFLRKVGKKYPEYALDSFVFSGQEKRVHWFALFLLEWWVFLCEFFKM